MKKLVSLLMTICVCFSICGFFASCEGSNGVVGQGQAPAVYKIEYHADVPNSPNQTVTYGQDANGNVHYTVITHYSAAPETEELLFIKQTDNSYKQYEFNEELQHYEFVQDATTTLSLPHSDYFKQGWYNKNNPNVREYDCVEIGISDVEAEDTAKGLLEELGCKYYKYQTDSNDGYAVMAVLPELDVVLYYGTNFEGYGSQASFYGGAYETKFLVKAFQLDHTDNYADLLK